MCLRNSQRISRRGLWFGVAAFFVAVLAGVVIGRYVVFAKEMHKTAYAATRDADQIVLTWSDDPRTTQAVQWRTSTGGDGNVDCIRYRRAGEAKWQVVKAVTTRIEDAYLENDKACAHHTARLDGLDPGTNYVYEVGNGTKWMSESHFSTAPGTGTKFSFIYMGDVQVGYEEWGTLLDAAFERHPDTAFFTVAGDLENHGCDRNEWDAFLHAGAGIFNHVAFVPVLGNHDKCNQGAMYRALFELPKNGPSSVAPELAYAFEYENALFVILNSEVRPSTQTAWLEKQLSQSKATWRFAVFHHPIYSPKADRDNAKLRKTWAPVFDKYHVDMVLTGHDHSYMRTYPLKDGKRTDKAGDGTVYVTSVSGTKYYDQQPGEQSAVAFANVSTYQVIDIDGNRLTYRAYDLQEKVMDELVIDNRL